MNERPEKPKKVIELGKPEKRIFTLDTIEGILADLSANQVNEVARKYGTSEAAVRAIAERAEAYDFSIRQERALKILRWR